MQKYKNTVETTRRGIEKGCEKMAKSKTWALQKWKHKSEEEGEE